MMKKRTGICKAAHISLAFFISTLQGTSAMERDYHKILEEIEELTARIHREVDRVLEDYKRDTAEYHRRMGTARTIPTATTMIPEIAENKGLKGASHGEESADLVKQGNFLDGKYYVKASGSRDFVYGTLNFSQEQPDQVKINDFKMEYNPFQGSLLYFRSENEGVDIDYVPALKKLKNGQYKLFVRHKDDSVHFVDPSTVGFDIDSLDELWGKKGYSATKFLKYDDKIMQDIILKGGHTTSFIDPESFIQNLKEKYSSDKYTYSIEYGDYQIARFMASVLPNTTFLLEAFSNDGCNLYFMAEDESRAEAERTPALKKRGSGDYILFVREKDGSVGERDPRALKIDVQDLNELWDHKQDSQPKFLRHTDKLLALILSGGHTLPKYPPQYAQRIQWDSGNDLNNMDIRLVIETDGNHSLLLVEYPYSLAGASAVQRLVVRKWNWSESYPFI
jgi:hypothetical protein